MSDLILNVIFLFAGAVLGVIATRIDDYLKKEVL